MTQYFLILFFFLFIAIAIFNIAFLVRYFALWLRAKLSRADVPFIQIIGMRLRKTNPAIIINNRIRAVQAGINIGAEDLESHYLAGGHIENIVAGLIAAKQASLELSLTTAAAVDLAGYDILNLVQKAIESKTSINEVLPFNKEKTIKEG